MRTGLYLFAVGRGLDSAAMSGVDGLGGSALEIVDCRDLQAVVCSVDLDEFGEDSLRTQPGRPGLAGAGGPRATTTSSSQLPRQAPWRRCGSSPSASRTRARCVTGSRHCTATCLPPWTGSRAAGSGVSRSTPQRAAEPPQELVGQQRRAGIGCRLPSTQARSRQIVVEPRVSDPLHVADEIHGELVRRRDSGQTARHPRTRG